MVDDALLSRDELPDEEWAITPGPDALVPDSIAREREREAFRAKLRDGPDTVIISHGDADGLTSAALLSETSAGECAFQTVGYQAPYRFEHVLEDLTDDELGFDPDGTQLYIADFNPDSAECADALTALSEQGCEIAWFDHHQWDDETSEAVQKAGVKLTINTDECTASLLGSLYDFDEQTQDLIDVTKDIDLWIRDDPRSPRLNTFASLVDEPEEYVYTVLDHGADFPEGIEERIDARIERNEELEASAVERADTHILGEEFDIAVTYTRGGRTSEIGNELVEDHDPLYDIAAVCTPESVSFYSHSNREGFARCHEIAAELGGGGHPTAAGCGVPVETFRDLARYWASAGESVRDDILDAVRAVVDDEGDAEWTAADVQADADGGSDSR